MKRDESKSISWTKCCIKTSVVYLVFSQLNTVGEKVTPVYLCEQLFSFIPLSLII